MIVVGLLRGVGGVTLLTQGEKVELGLPVIASPTELKIVAYTLIAVCLLLIVSAISLTIRRLVSNYAFCWLSLLLFLASGLANSVLLFGRPLGSGQLINWGVSFVIGVCLVLGKNAVHSKYIQEYENK